MAFIGPKQDIYTALQLANAYEVTEARVLLWLRRGYLRGRPSIITHHDVLVMRKYHGDPDNPKSSLP